MSELLADRVRDHATKLGLTHLAEHLTTLTQRAETQQMGYLDYTDLLLGEELGIRESRRFRSLLQQSGLPHHKSLDEFDFTFQPDLDRRKVRDLAALDFIADKANIALLGPPGVGKTHLAVALAVAACQAGYRAYFTSLDDLVRKLRAAADSPTRLQRQLMAYVRPHLLLIDELGYMPLDRTDANLIFQLISHRYEKGSIILTSNKSFAEWGGVFGDDALATAILDRFLHHAHVITINGPSYRLKDRLTTPTASNTDQPDTINPPNTDT
jgi:DNA replication protein DnaC